MDARSAAGALATSERKAPADLRSSSLQRRRRGRRDAQRGRDHAFARERLRLVERGLPGCGLPERAIQARGEGHARRQAEQQAAQRVFEQLDSEPSKGRFT